MRRMLLVVFVVLLAAGGCAGRARAGANGAATPPPSITSGPAARSDVAGIYSAMLRRYLTTSDHSFGESHRFPIAYVLDMTDSTVAEAVPSGRPAEWARISLADQTAIAADLTDVGPVRFISDRDSVVEERDHCQQVRGGGVLIILAPPVPVRDHLEVGIHGFVACLGATWFTYVVIRDGTGWKVTGTTGPMAIA